MRKIVMFALMATAAVPTALIPTAASAQSRAEIRHDRRVVREERQELRQARRFGTRQDVRAERRDLNRARQELREDRRDRRYSRYVAPYRSWSYRPVRIGFQLSPAFYAPSYYIADPFQYRLPLAGRFQRWIRYGDDLLLVNVRTGRVIQVIHNRYW